MAQRVITYVEFTDDLNGQPFAEGEGETVTYALDGSTYEIDLNHANAAEFRELFGPYLKASRKRTDTRGGEGTRGRKRTRAQMKAIRVWARDNGYEVGDNGRVPWHIVQAYDRVNPGQ